MESVPDLSGRGEVEAIGNGRYCFRDGEGSMAFRGEFGGRMSGFDVSSFQPHLVTRLIRCERFGGSGHETLGF